MDTVNLQKSKALRIFGIIIMIVGVVLAFCTNELELLDSVILDGDTGNVPVGITLHIIIISLFTFASVLLLYLSNKADPNCIFSERQNIEFHILCGVIGLLFTIATGCSERSQELFQYLEHIDMQPYWFIQDIINMPGFDNIDDVAKDLSNTAIIFYILTIVGLVALVVYCVKNVDKFKNKIIAMINEN